MIRNRRKAVCSRTIITIVDLVQIIFVVLYDRQSMLWFV
jgi:hypothetical protein